MSDLVLGDLRTAIPTECFQHSTLQALLLVLRDFVLMLALFLLAGAFLHVPSTIAEPLPYWEYLAWGIYVFAQGTCAVGWWVLAHECGHGGFTKHQVLNDVVGWCLHSFLLVPYFSWQHSHRKHHAKCNHLMDGESHVPNTKAELESLGAGRVHEVLGDECFAVIEVLGHLLMGFPLYLFFNFTGGRRLGGKEIRQPLPIIDGVIADHFNPYSALFPKGWRLRIVVSDLGVLLTIALLRFAWCRFGWQAVLFHYVLPYLWVNFWAVLYTWLQHTSPEVPHYGDEHWTWLKGALSTVDRPYGIFDYLHHNIGSTHLCHHLFPKLPCYRADVATKHLRTYLEAKHPGLYQYDPTPWPIALWRVATACHYVENTNGTQYYQSFSFKSEKAMATGPGGGTKLAKHT